MRPRAVALDCLGNGQIQWSTDTNPNGRLMWPGPQTVNSACPVRTGVSDAPVDGKLVLLSNDYNCGGGYEYPPNRPFEGVGPQETYQGIL
jgi:hypothetical protein